MPRQGKAPTEDATPVPSPEEAGETHPVVPLEGEELADARDESARAGGVEPPDFSVPETAPTMVATGPAGGTGDAAAQSVRTPRRPEAPTRLARNKPISDEMLDRMSGAEIKAVAHDRGYDIKFDMGGGAARSLFKKLQGKDEEITEKNEEPGE